MEVMEMRYFGIIGANHPETKGFILFLNEKDVVKYAKEQINELEIDEEDENALDLKEKIKEVEEMIQENETDLENYCYKHSDLILGDSESVVELYKVDNEENVYTYEYDSKNFKIEILRGNYFVKEIKE
jgi:hypothetical protein